MIRLQAYEDLGFEPEELQKMLQNAGYITRPVCETAAPDYPPIRYHKPIPVPKRKDWLSFDDTFSAALRKRKEYTGDTWPVIAKKLGVSRAALMFIAGGKTKSMTTHTYEALAMYIGGIEE